MNLAELQQKLIAAARAHPPSGHVPYAFEKRITARLALRPALDAGALWARALWRAAASCVAVVILLSVLTLFVPRSSPRYSDLSQDFESTVFAAVAQDADYSW